MFLNIKIIKLFLGIQETLETALKDDFLVSHPVNNKKDIDVSIKLK